MEFKDKFIGFIDILGFKNLVNSAECGNGISLPDLLKITKKLGSSEDRNHLIKYGPTTCPQSLFLQRNLDFQITQILDCVVVSVEISPAGVINLIGHGWKALIKLLQDGIMCRGYITRGMIYHTEKELVGSGYQKAYAKEKEVTAFKREADERGTPFVEVDPVVCNYVKNNGDECIKKMFSRYVKQEKEITALFPFKRLCHSFAITHDLNPEKERKSNKNLRQWIKNFKDRIMRYVDESNPSAVKKAQHYIDALNAQLSICDETDDFINTLNSSFPSCNF